MNLHLITCVSGHNGKKKTGKWTCSDTRDIMWNYSGSVWISCPTGGLPCVYWLMFLIFLRQLHLFIQWICAPHLSSLTSECVTLWWLHPEIIIPWQLIVHLSQTTELLKMKWLRLVHRTFPFVLHHCFILGLTLTEANAVVFAELFWNPGVSDTLFSLLSLVM